MRQSDSLDDELPIPLIHTDRSLRALSVNRAWRELTDGDAATNGDGWLDFFDPADHRRLRNALSAALVTGTTVRADARDRVAGMTFAVHAAAVDDAAPGLVVAILDFERDQHRADVDPTSELMATLSHELRRPLSVLATATQLLEDQGEQLTAEQRTRLAEMLRRQTDSMTAMVDHFLEDARLRAGDVSHERKELVLGETIDEVVADVATMYPEQRFEVDVPAGLSTSTDANAVEHIVGNLLTNAAKVSPPGGMVRVVARHPGQFVIVSVVDEGPGIAPELRERIFERWYRAPGAATTAGAGLGLAIAREHAELLGGQLWVESGPWQGAKFSFSLPLVAADRARPEGGNK